MLNIEFENEIELTLVFEDLLKRDLYKLGLLYFMKRATTKKKYYYWLFKFSDGGVVRSLTSAAFV